MANSDRSQQYKVTVEIAGLDTQGFNGWFELSQGPIINNQHSSTLSQATASGHRLTLSFMGLDPQPYNLWLVIGSKHAYNGSYYLPLGRRVKPVSHGLDKNEWDNVLVPVVPLGGSEHPHALEPGWMYVYVNGFLWRELEIINELGAMRDVDLSMQAVRDSREASCHVQPHVLVPYKINAEVVDIALNYSASQLPWSMLCSLGGIAPNDNRFSVSVRKHARSIPPNAALQQDLLQSIDLSTYPKGFRGANQVVPIDSCPKIGTPSQPQSDLLRPFRATKIPVVFMQN